MSTDDLARALAECRHMPADEVPRNRFLALACTLVSANPNVHFIHSNPDVHEFIGILAIQQPDDHLKQVHNILAGHLSECIECVRTFQTLKTTFFAHSASVFSPESLVGFRKQLYEWDIARYQIILRHFSSKLHILSSKTTASNRFRNSTLFTIYEILSFPSSLMNVQVETLFSQVLLEINRQGLKLRDMVYPGSFYLI